MLNTQVMLQDAQIKYLFINVSIVIISIILNFQLNLNMYNQSKYSV
jgi:hypothetical protein